MPVPYIVTVEAHIPQNLWEYLPPENQKQTTQLIARLVYNWIIYQRLEVKYD